MAERRFVAEQERQSGYTHVVLITTGSVASIKAPLIVKELLQVCEAGPPLLNMTLTSLLSTRK